MLRKRRQHVVLRSRPRRSHHLLRGHERRLRLLQRSLLTAAAVGAHGSEAVQRGPPTRPADEAALRSAHGLDPADPPPARAQSLVLLRSEDSGRLATTHPGLVREFLRRARKSTCASTALLRLPSRCSSCSGAVPASRSDDARAEVPAIDREHSSVAPRFPSTGRAGSGSRRSRPSSVPSRRNRRRNANSYDRTHEGRRTRRRDDSRWSRPSRDPIVHRD